jgi:methyltransferase (TIGR00027 family)
MATKQGVGSTALGVATFRLIEQYQPKEIRMFDDPVVRDLLDAPTQAMMQFASTRVFMIEQMEAIGKGLYGGQVCRTRYIDDAVEAALAAGINQVVILGAGFDTRPYRLPGMEQVKVFEVDLPGVQSDKKKRLQKRFGHLPENVTFIPIDFETQTLESVFAGTTFDSSSPAVFVWEGVTPYISEKAVSQTLSFVGNSAPGSILVFTYILKSVISRRSQIADANKINDAVADHAHWIFGLEPASLKEYLLPYHLSLVADVGDADYQEKYLRPLKRKLDVFEGERVAQAVVFKEAS